MGTEEKSKSRMKWWAAIGLTLCTTIAFSFYVRIVLPTRETEVVVRAYRQLEVGAPRDTLASLFPRDPDLVCTFSRAQVLYYHADPRAHFIPGFGDTQVERVRDTKERGTVLADDLPYLYGYAQILVNTETNMVVAKSWNGEELQVHSSRGDFPGSTLGDLPADIQVALHLIPGESGRTK